MRRVRGTWVVLWLCAGLLAAGQERRQSGTLPDETRKRVDAVFAAYDRPDSPGCALGVARGGELVYARGYGLANLEHGIPISPNTIFDIGSTSKQFTATAILLLSQQGKLALDDDVRKLLPELRDYGKTVTIRHLLHHTSGLRDYLTLMSLAGEDFDGVTGDDEALEIITRQEALNFAPGDEHLYSNSGYFLLSLIVKRASGQSLGEFAAAEIFGPLGMQQTHFHDDHTMLVPKRATAYAPRRGGGWQIAMSGFEQTGDGAVYTSIDDLVRWDANFYEPRVGGQPLLEALHATGVLNDGTRLTYASGLIVATYRGLRKVNHGGSWAGYRADLIRFPDERLSVISLCNAANSNPSRLAQQVADLFLAGRLAPDPVGAGGAPATPAARPDVSRPVGSFDPSPAQLRQFAGTYFSEEIDSTYRLEVVDGKLQARVRTRPARTLEPARPDTFTASGGAEFEFRRDAAGNVTGFGVSAGRIRNVRFVRKEGGSSALVAIPPPTAASADARSAEREIRLYKQTSWCKPW